MQTQILCSIVVRCSPTISYLYISFHSRLLAIGSPGVPFVSIPFPRCLKKHTFLCQAYILIAAPLSWAGLFKAHVHPALSLLSCQCCSHIGIQYTQYTQLRWIAVEMQDSVVPSLLGCSVSHQLCKSFFLKSWVARCWAMTWAICRATCHMLYNII